MLSATSRDRAKYETTKGYSFPAPQREKRQSLPASFRSKSFAPAPPSQRCSVPRTTDNVRLSFNNLCSRQIAAATERSLSRIGKLTSIPVATQTISQGFRPRNPKGTSIKCPEFASKETDLHFKAGAILRMCFLNHITWQKCGHFTTITEPCSEARRRSPPTPCTSVHAPKATTLPVQSGSCPDQTKHPRRQDQSGTSRPHLPTYGDGNAVFCNGQAQR